MAGFGSWIDLTAGDIRELRTVPKIVSDTWDVELLSVSENEQRTVTLCSVALMLTRFLGHLITRETV